MFLREVERRHGALGVPRGAVVAVEIDAQASAMLGERHPAARVLHGDFLAMDRSDLGRFDCVVGNPPYIRVRHQDRDARASGRRRAEGVGVDLSGLASSWAHFTVHATTFLRDTGRFAFVLPAELLTANYGRSVLEFLHRRFDSLVMVAFDTPVFDGALVDALLVLASADGPAGQRMITLPDVDALSAIAAGGPLVSAAPRGGRRPAVTVEIETAYARLASSGTTVRLRDLAKVDIGVVSGGAQFFVLDEQRRIDLRLAPPEVRPYVRRGRDLRGLAVADDETQWLFSAGSAMSEAARRYVGSKASLAVRTGYKVSRRATWHEVPIPHRRPDLLFPPMIHRFPRLVANTNRRLASNLLYHVESADPRATSVRALAARSLSSVFSLSCEMEGRPFAGGVLKIEPSESERLLVPRASLEQDRRLARMFPTLDRLVRDGHLEEAQRRVDDVLDVEAADLVRMRDELRTRRLGFGLRR